MSEQKICIICARGGSKGLPGKNIKPLCGKPLIAYSIEQAKETSIFSHIVVSSDSDEILDIAKRYGADIVKRPDNLATDAAETIPAMIDALSNFEKETAKIFDIITLLQPTSPIRSVEDIVNTVNLCTQTDAPNVVSVTESNHNPYYNILEKDEEGNIALSKQLPAPITRRQDAPKCYTINGSIYVWKRDALINGQKTIFPDSKVYAMPQERSVDIDTIWDFKYAQALMEG